TALGSDDQTVDQFTFNTTNNQLSISLENDGAAPLIVDLSSLASTVTTNSPVGGLSGRTIATHTANATVSTIQESITTTTQATGNTDTEVGSSDANTIATHTSENGTVTNINETVTSLSQDDTPSTTDPSATGEITFTDETGTTSTAQVVAAEADNNIKVGANGGAYFAGPVIYSAGKVNADGTTNPGAIYNATITKLTTNNGGGGTEGDYQVTFTTALTNTNYIIQLTIPDCGGNCPGNTNANYDDPGITYYDQTVNGFKVNIKDSDNGTSQGDDIDLDFMFTVIKLP
ncbi:hypothetical protein, partial [Tenacibaculum sp. M341]